MQSITSGTLGKEEDGFFFPVESLYGYLEQVTDLRDPRGVRYPLVVILALIVIAKIAQQPTLQAIAEWLAPRAPSLVKALHLRRCTMPHRTTLGRVLARGVPVGELDALVSRFLTQLPRPAAAEYVLNLDGKTVRGTLDRRTGHQEHVLAAYLPHEGFVLVQVAVERKENEISAAPRVLDCIDLRDAVVTGDALLAQRALSAQIVAAGGHYLWKVKAGGATQTLYAELETLFAPPTCPPGTSPTPTDFRTATTIDKGHGRKERRTITVSQMLTGYSAWPHLAQVFRVERQVRDLPTDTVTTYVTYGITSLPPSTAGPARLVRLVRLHWQIENGLHYRKDVTLREDACRVRTGDAAQVLAVLNNLVVGLLRNQQPDMTLPQAQRYYAAHRSQLIKLICEPIA